MISHSTLAGIEGGALPSIYKILSLAYCLRITDEEILQWYDIDLPGIRLLLRQRAERQAETLKHAGSSIRETHFPFHWPFEPPLPRTDLFSFRAKRIHASDQERYRYAWIGSQDDCMMEIVTSGSIVRVDTHQRRVVVFSWPTLRHRPIYLVWHQYGHSCCWCQQNGSDLYLIFHPASNCPTRRLRMPREASIIGRVVSVWPAPEDPVIEFPTVDLPNAKASIKYR